MAKQKKIDQVVKAADTDSLDDQVQDVRDAFYHAFPVPSMDQVYDLASAWVVEVYSSYVIACIGEDYFKIGYTVDPADDENITFETRDQWIEVEQAWVAANEKSFRFPRPLAMKVGARHSSKDVKDVQTVHDAAQRLGAMCDPDNAKSVEMSDHLIAFGGAVKATKMDDGAVKLGGYLVRFGDEDSPDVTGEFFTKNTDFGDATKSDGFFNHRFPVVIEDKSFQYKSKIGKAEMKVDDVGVYADIIIRAHNEYEKAIVEAGLAGKLGWSSGTAGHLVEREPVGKAMKITAWPLGLDASLTPTPAEYRNSNMVIPLKSLLSVSTQASKAQAGQDKPTSSGEPGSVKNNIQQGDKMELTKEELQQMITDASKTSADEAVKAYVEKTEPVTKSGVKVTKDAADQPFASDKEFFMAVKMAGINPGQVDQRLLAMKAPAGMSEGVPSDGGFLLLPSMATGIMERMYSQGDVLSKISKDPIGPNSNATLYNGVDETSRAAGSRWGGILGYWLAEGVAPTATKPKFYQVPLKLKKVGALCYATDEQLMDSTQLASWLNRTVPKELTFMTEDAIFNGTGGGMPLGIMNASCVNPFTRLDASKIQIQDVSGMLSYLWMGNGMKSAAWFADQSIIPQLAQLVIGNYPAFLPSSQGAVGDMPATLMGRPIYFTEYGAALGTVGDLLLCDMSQYQGIDKEGIQQASSIHVNFLTDEQVFRFIYRFDGAPLWKTTLTTKSSKTVSPFVSLTTAT